VICLLALPPINSLDMGDTDAFESSASEEEECCNSECSSALQSSTSEVDCSLSPKQSVQQIEDGVDESHVLDSIVTCSLRFNAPLVAPPSLPRGRVASPLTSPLGSPRAGSGIVLYASGSPPGTTSPCRGPPSPPAPSPRSLRAGSCSGDYTLAATGNAVGDRCGSIHDLGRLGDVGVSQQSFAPTMAGDAMKCAASHQWSCIAKHPPALQMSCSASEAISGAEFTDEFISAALTDDIVLSELSTFDGEYPSAIASAMAGTTPAVVVDSGTDIPAEAVVTAANSATVVDDATYANSVAAGQDEEARHDRAENDSAHNELMLETVDEVKPQTEGIKPHGTTTSEAHAHSSTSSERRRQHKHLSRSFASAAQTLQHHLLMCLKVLSIMHDRYAARCKRIGSMCLHEGSTEPKVLHESMPSPHLPHLTLNADSCVPGLPYKPPDGLLVPDVSNQQSGNRFLLAMVMLDAHLSGALSTTEQAQIQCFQEFPETKRCQQDEFISFDGTLTTVYEDEDFQTKRQRSRVFTEAPCAMDDYSQLQQEIRRLQDSIPALQRERSDVNASLRQLEDTWQKLKRQMDKMAQEVDDTSTQEQQTESGVNSNAVDAVKQCSAEQNQLQERLHRDSHEAENLRQSAVAATARAEAAVTEFLAWEQEGNELLQTLGTSSRQTLLDSVQKLVQRRNKLRAAKRQARKVPTQICWDAPNSSDISPGACGSSAHPAASSESDTHSHRQVSEVAEKEQPTRRPRKSSSATSLLHDTPRLESDSKLQELNTRIAEVKRQYRNIVFENSRLRTVGALMGTRSYSAARFENSSSFCTGGPSQCSLSPGSARLQNRSLSMTSLRSMSSDRSPESQVSHHLENEVRKCCSKWLARGLDVHGTKSPPGDGLFCGDEAVMYLGDDDEDDDVQTDDVDEEDDDNDAIDDGDDDDKDALGGYEKNNGNFSVNGTHYRHNIGCADQGDCRKGLNHNPAELGDRDCLSACPVNDPVLIRCKTSMMSAPDLRSHQQKSPRPSGRREQQPKEKGTPRVRGEVQNSCSAWQHQPQGHVPAALVAKSPVVMLSGSSHNNSGRGRLHSGTSPSLSSATTNTAAPSSARCPSPSSKHPQPPRASRPQKIAIRDTLPAPCSEGGALDSDRQPAPEPLPEAGVHSPPAAIGRRARVTSASVTEPGSPKPGPAANCSKTAAGASTASGSSTGTLYRQVATVPVSWERCGGRTSPPRRVASESSEPVCNFNNTSPHRQRHVQLLASPPFPPPASPPPELPRHASTQSPRPTPGRRLTSTSPVRPAMATASSGPKVQASIVAQQPTLTRGHVHSSSASSLGAPRPPSPELARSASAVLSPEILSHSQSPRSTGRAVSPCVAIQPPEAPPQVTNRPQSSVRTTWPSPTVHMHIVRHGNGQRAFPRQNAQV